VITNDAYAPVIELLEARPKLFALKALARIGYTVSLLVNTAMTAFGA
jgi:hypothetical protein